MTHIAIFIAFMKTTIDLPEDVLRRTKVAAAMRSTTLKNLVIKGLEMVLREESGSFDASGALARLHKGYHLGGKPLEREQAHAR